MNCCPVCNKKLKFNVTRCEACGTDLNFFQTIKEIPPKLLLQAEHAEKIGNKIQAIGYYQVAHQLIPKDPEPLKRMAFLLEKENKKKEALAAWRKLIVLVPDDQHALKAIEKENKVSNFYPLYAKFKPILGYWVIAPIAIFIIVLSWIIYYFYPYSSPETANSSPKNPIIANSDTIKNTSGLKIDHTGAAKLAAKIQAELPPEIHIEVVGNGLKLTGELFYLWEKYELERKAATWDVLLVDLISVKVRYPEAFLYRVSKGDTLGRLAQIFLGSVGRWREIYTANRDQLSNPDRLLAGQLLVIHQPEEGNERR